MNGVDGEGSEVGAIDGGSPGPAASPAWRVLLALMRALPQGALSRGWGWLMRRRLPAAIQGPANRLFARVFDVDTTEAEHPPEAYPTVAEFFVRRLRDGARSWPEAPGVPGSPVDGVLGTYGTFAGGTVLQAKGIRYGVDELLGGGAAAAPFVSGLFFTIYLSPRHYHRIHTPLSGCVEGARSIPGRLLPVNVPAVRTIHDLFPRNERLVAFLGCGETQAALVAVGAYNVGRISAAFDPEWNGAGGGAVTNVARRGLATRTYEPPVPVERGSELMAFHFGSTVVLLFSDRPGKKLPSAHPELAEGRELSLGDPLLGAGL